MLAIVSPQQINEKLSIGIEGSQLNGSVNEVA